jgi:hypothetical protein
MIPETGVFPLPIRFEAIVTDSADQGNTATWWRGRFAIQRRLWRLAGSASGQRAARRAPVILQASRATMSPGPRGIFRHGALVGTDTKGDMQPMAAGLCQDV